MDLPAIVRSQRRRQRRREGQDKVPHSRLINKIKTHGIGCFVANWIDS